MFRRVLALAVGMGLWCGSARAQAMPWGIVVDKDGIVYVSDMYHQKGCVYRIVPGKPPEVAIARRCYDIALDAEGRLVGLERSRLYDEGRIWRASDDRPVAEFRVPRPLDGRHYFWGEFIPYPGRGYCVRFDHRLWLVRGNEPPKLLAGGACGERDGHGGEAQFSSLVGGLALKPNGDLVVVDGNRLRIVTPRGSVSTLRRDLSDSQPGDARPGHPPYGEGVALADDGGIYVAVGALCAVRKITAEGRLTTFTRAEDRWEPMGLCFHKGDLYISESRFVPPLEYEGPRVVKVSANGEREVLVNLGLGRPIVED